MKQIAGITIALLLAPLAGAAAPMKPNIVFIMADDLGWRDLGCFGSKCACQAAIGPEAPTPDFRNIDRPDVIWMRGGDRARFCLFPGFLRRGCRG